MIVVYTNCLKTWNKSTEIQQADRSCSICGDPEQIITYPGYKYVMDV